MPANVRGTNSAWKHFNSLRKVIIHEPVTWMNCFSMSPPKHSRYRSVVFGMLRKIGLATQSWGCHTKTHSVMKWDSFPLACVKVDYSEVHCWVDAADRQRAVLSSSDSCEKNTLPGELFCISAVSPQQEVCVCVLEQRCSTRQAIMYLNLWGLCVNGVLLALLSFFLLRD